MNATTVASDFRAVAAALLILLPGCGHAAQPVGLQLEQRIPLGEVRGRIDHLAVDPGRRRLYVAELGNDSVGVVDLEEGKTIRTLTGLGEPQGIGYVGATDTLYVANARDGTVRLFQGRDLTPAGQITLGDDADNVRVDEAAHRVFVGYGSGALGIIDTEKRAKVADVPLKGHPESFRLQTPGDRIFVNVPDAHEIAVVDRATYRQTASWQTDGLRWNFPLALDTSGHVLVIFRFPSRLAVFNQQDGHLISKVPACGDSDDVFFDAKRHRVYVSCGEGYLDVFSGQGDTYVRIGHLATAAGARTALFVADTDRLFLAVRASDRAPASVWVFRPVD